MIRPLRATTLHAATLLAAALTTVLLSPTGAGAAPATPAAGAGTGKPTVGDCYALTVAQIDKVSNTSRPVACTSRHTTVVSGVRYLPSGLSWKSPKDDLVAAASRLCFPTEAKAVGGDYADRALTRYTLAFFFPTQGQKSAGARWIRCDVYLLAGDSVQPILESRTPLLKKGVSRRVLRCGNARSSIIECSRPHQYRAVGAFRVAMTSYPTQKQYERLAVRRCPAYTGGRDIYSTIRSRGTWNLGDRTITCFVKTTN